ncbi:MAG: hypothetical protein O7H40_00440 [Gammaproteobacteria bacterium]|nr:hypothetical protein [Gammaproteobacteria bacterium]
MRNGRYDKQLRIAQRYLIRPIENQVRVTLREDDVFEIYAV